MRCVIPILIVVVAAGCSLTGDDDGTATISRKELSRLVLLRGDLPRVFVQFDGGPQGRADLPPGERSDPSRFGREAGWKSRFRRPGSATTRGPLVIESRADLFDSSDGARQDLDALEMSGFSEEEPPPNLGDEGRALATPEGPAQTVRYFLIAWRDENLLATILVSGFQGKISFTDASTLAQKMQARIGRAASS
jgi:hypothetical protein